MITTNTNYSSVYILECKNVIAREVESIVSKNKNKPLEIIAEKCVAKINQELNDQRWKHYAELSVFFASEFARNCIKLATLELATNITKALSKSKRFNGVAS